MKEISELIQITDRLRHKYKRAFTLDGKLVGDIGEVLAAEKYGLQLLSSNSWKHDARELKTNRFVQIKSSFLDVSYFPCNHVPDYYLAIKINIDGTIKELFNGRGSFIVKNYIQKRHLKKSNNRYLYTLSAGILVKLNEKENDRYKIKNSI